MTPEKTIPNIDDLIRRYLSGIPVKKLAEEVGLRPPALSLRFAKAGVKLRGRAEARRLRVALPADVRDLLQKSYRAGESVPDLSKRTGLTPWQIYGFFKSIGLQRRSHSESRQTKWESFSPEERAAHTAASLGRAWDARRGQRIPLETKIRSAKTRFERLDNIGKGEEELANALKDVGMQVSQQFPIGPYNVDLAIRHHRIAVEVERPKSPTHGSSRIAAERTKYILDEGWALLYVFLDSIGRDAGLDVPCAVKDVVAVAERMSGGEALRGQYGVIGRDRKASPGFRSKLNDLPRIPRL